MTQDTIALGQYLFERLKQKPFNIETIFGVAGDFNLLLLDQINENGADMRWAGNTNELNAAYAADGYSRTKHVIDEGAQGGLSAIVTTFGVGELSAINGLAGSFAEHVGVLHIVGTPPVAAQAQKKILHHSLGDGDFGVFARMSAAISCATTMLDNFENACQEIDRVISEAYTQQRPAYLGFPSDLVEIQIPLSRLDTPLCMTPPLDKSVEDSGAASAIMEALLCSKDPLIVIDACCVRHGSSKAALQLVERTNIKFVSMPMTKGGKNIDETLPQYLGTCMGKPTLPEVQQAIDKSDLIIWLGPFKADGNTGFFTLSFKDIPVIEVHPNRVLIENEVFKQSMEDLLKILLQMVLNTPFDFGPHDFPPATYYARSTGLHITQDFLWSAVSKWLEPGDVIISDVGTSVFGLLGQPFPQGVSHLCQLMWGSIGYSVGATLGAAMAVQEGQRIRPHRTILFVGDGALQMSVQEILTMARHD